MFSFPTAMTLLSAIALGLVMCLHVPTLPRFWLFDLGVPWFFFASGVWYAQKVRTSRMGEGAGYGAQVRVRVRTLLAPYFLWNLIWFPILLAGNWLGWRYCGASRVVDGSMGCVIRCLGLSPFAWPALVPTWFLRALFVAVVIVGGVREVWKFGSLESWKFGSFGGCKVLDLLLALAFWTIYWTRGWWMPSGAQWEGFFSFGIPLLGCACFATGIAFGEGLKGWKVEQPRFAGLIRRQMMPVYILHAAVIVSVGWVAKALGAFGLLATVTGDVVMWFVGAAGAVAIGEALRRYAPKAANVLFGGR